MGGEDCDKLQVLEMSEENGFSWTVKADLPASRFGAASVVHDGRLWLIGGILNYNLSSSVAIYDIEADSWGMGPALPRGVVEGCATTLNGEVFVASRQQCWIYRNATWVDLPRGPGAQEAVSASILLG